MRHLFARKALSSLSLSAAGCVCLLRNGRIGKEILLSLGNGWQSLEPVRFRPDQPTACITALRPSINQTLALFTVADAIRLRAQVHGDMGRTQPSLAGLLRCDAADILQLDVVAVEH